MLTSLAGLATEQRREIALLSASLRRSAEGVESATTRPELQRAWPHGLHHPAAGPQHASLNRSTGSLRRCWGASSAARGRWASCPRRDLYEQPEPGRAERQPPASNVRLAHGRHQAQPEVHQPGSVLTATAKEKGGSGRSAPLRFLPPASEREADVHQADGGDNPGSRCRVVGAPEQALRPCPPPLEVVSGSQEPAVVGVERPVQVASSRDRP
jgi:hypothetical protein